MVDHRLMPPTSGTHKCLPSGRSSPLALGGPLFFFLRETLGAFRGQSALKSSAQADLPRIPSR